MPPTGEIGVQELAALILTIGEDVGGDVSAGVQDKGSGARELLFGLGVPDQPDRVAGVVNSALIIDEIL